MFSLEELQEKFEYDEVTGAVWILNCGPWRKRRLGRAISADGYYRSNVKINEAQHALLLHRVAYQIYHKRLLSPEEIIDHDDQDKLNNKIENLKLTNRAENNKNLALRKRNKSGVSNCYQLPSGKFRVQIRVNNKTTHVGCFETLQEAAEAKRKANAKYGFNPNHN